MCVCVWQEHAGGPAAALLQTPAGSSLVLVVAVVLEEFLIPRGRICHPILHLRETGENVPEQL